MQELLSEMLWGCGEIHTAAARLCQTMPGYPEAYRRSEAASQQIQDLLGYELSNQLLEQLNLSVSYELRAYYCLGLGLREELAQALNL